MNLSSDSPPGYDSVQTDIVALVNVSRATVARNVNALMTATYWEIGRRIVQFEQGGEARAVYGEAPIRWLYPVWFNHFPLRRFRQQCYCDDSDHTGY